MQIETMKAISVFATGCFDPMTLHLLARLDSELNNWEINAL
jgi:hypothetical protein